MQRGYTKASSPADSPCDAPRRNEGYTEAFSSPAKSPCDESLRESPVYNPRAGVSRQANKGAVDDNGHRIEMALYCTASANPCDAPDAMETV